MLREKDYDMNNMCLIGLVTLIILLSYPCLIGIPSVSHQAFAFGLHAYQHWWAWHRMWNPYQHWWAWHPKMAPKR
jgi:hypothetical protein